MVRCNQYSVPARFIGHRLRVKLSASAVIVYDRTTVVARHQRAVGKGAKVLDLDHYLEILHRKPGALPGATALAQARAAKKFTATHDAFWAAAQRILHLAAAAELPIRDRNGQQRLAEMNRTVYKNLLAIIDGLTTPCGGNCGPSCSWRCLRPFR
jgi:nucleoside-diphosphate-sugar epimerase